MGMINVEKALWTDEYATGNETIDGQHKQLFEIFNNLVDALFVTGEAELKAQETLIKLVDYMQFHFIDEEALWKLNDEIYQRHRQAHYSFSEMIMSSTRKDMKKENFSLDLLFFIRDWLTAHIIKMDQEDFQKLKDKGLV